jgi:hypothetical protein
MNFRLYSLFDLQINKTNKGRKEQRKSTAGDECHSQNPAFSAGVLNHRGIGFEGRGGYSCRSTGLPGRNEGTLAAAGPLTCSCG